MVCIARVKFSVAAKRGHTVQYTLSGLCFWLSFWSIRWSCINQHLTTL